MKKLKKWLKEVFQEPKPLKHYSIPLKFNYLIPARNKKEAKKLALKEVQKRTAKWSKS